MEVEAVFKDLLQRNVTITTRTRNLGNDRLINFEIKDFNVQLKFPPAKAIHIPWPFEVSKEGKDRYVLNYCLSAILGDDPILNFKAKQASQNTNNRFYDIKAAIEVND